MPREQPSAWDLLCPWCEWKIIVNARGQRGKDPGSGVQAARLMRKHVEFRHGRSWTEFLRAEVPDSSSRAYTKRCYTLGDGNWNRGE
jgi:hypothetical protein